MALGEHGGGAGGQIIELAQSQLTRHAFRKQVLGVLEREIGFDGALMDTLDPALHLAHCASVGVDPSYLELARVHWTSRYAAEVSPLFSAAAQAGGVVVDSEVFGPRDRDRRRYYAEIMEPLHFGHTLWAHLRVRGTVVSSLALGRPKRARPFEEKHVALLRSLSPMLALADGSFGPAERPVVAPVASALSPREREIASLVGLGYTNREIALALGTSANTVRNQLVALFRKAEVTTRAELAGLFGRVGTAP